MNLSCSSKPTDLRTLVPADTLIYLETNDLAAALQPIIDSKPFTEVAKSKPDLSALKGVQIAVAVTGFETSEEKLTDDQSVGRIQPKFVAVADTHAWNYQAVKFAEQKLGSFVARIYESEPKLETTDAKGGKYFTWTAPDNRKAHALVIDSLVYFTNDEALIDKFLAVRRGVADNIIKIGKVQPADAANLATGYVSADGAATIADIAALNFAADASNESQVQSAIASMIPQILRGTVTDVSWIQTKTEFGLEDRWQINMPTDVATVFAETMAPSASPDYAVTEFFSTARPITVYNLKEPHLAWRSLLLVVRRKSDALSGQAFSAFAQTMVEPFGVRDAEGFLSSVRSVIVTSRCDLDGEDGSPLLGATRNSDKTHSFMVPNILVTKSDEGASLFKSADNELAAYFDGGQVIAGDFECVKKVGGASYMGIPETESGAGKLFNGRMATVITTGLELNSDYRGLVNLLVEKPEASPVSMKYTTETRFNRSGMERKTTSDFGFIGWIIAQLNED